MTIAVRTLVRSNEDHNEVVSTVVFIEVPVDVYYNVDHNKKVVLAVQIIRITEVLNKNYKIYDSKIVKIHL